MLTELLLWGPQVAAEAAGVPYVVLNPTINVIPAPGVPPFGLGLMPATSAEEHRRDEEVAAVLAGDGYRAAAERIARVIAEETASDQVVAEIEALVAEREAVGV